jgi:hypothetical protein
MIISSLCALVAGQREGSIRPLFNGEHDVETQKQHEKMLLNKRAESLGKLHLNRKPSLYQIDQSSAALLKGLKLCTNVADIEQGSLLVADFKELLSPQLTLDQLKDAELGNSAFPSSLMQRNLNDALRYTGSCQNNTNLIVVENYTCGVGCTLGYLVKPVIEALIKKQHLLTPLHAYIDSRAGHDFGDFFRPYSQCSPAVLEDEAINGGATHVNVEESEFFEQLSYEHQFMPKQKASNTNKQAVPDWLQHDDDRQYFWLVTQVIGAILSPSTRIKARVDAIATEMDFNSHRPILGVHVRVGDACYGQDHRQCLGLPEYMVHIERLAKAVGYKSVYIATDSGKCSV